MSEISTIEEKFTSSGVHQRRMLPKRQKTLKRLLQSFEERLNLLPNADSEALRSLYYEAAIKVTHSHYLEAERLFATNAIWESRSKEESDEIERGLRERIIPIMVLCQESD